jgi:DME family drug/metabolite transporter
MSVARTFRKQPVMSTSRSSARLGLLQICIAGILWGTGGLVVQLIRERVPLSVLTISAWRMSLAALVLIAAVAVLRRGAGVRTLLRTRPWTAIAVGLATGAYQALYFAAVVAVGVTVSTVVALGLAPVLLTAWESVVARRLPGRTRFLVLASALSGLVLVSTSAGVSTTGPHPLLGVLLAVASGSAYAVATTLGRPLAGTTSPLVLTTVTSSAGALGLLPLALVGGGPYVTGDLPSLGLLAYLGVMTLALAYALLYAGLRTVTGSAAVVATLLEPVTAAVLAVVVLGERLAALGVVGAVLILLAVTGLEGGEERSVPDGPAPL